MVPPTTLEAWKLLQQHYEEVGKNIKLMDLFQQDKKRFEDFHQKMSLTSNKEGHSVQLLVDYSKHLLTRETLELLEKLVKEAKVEELRDKMMTGRKINLTEDRPVLHIALRNRSNKPIIVGGEDVMPEVNRVLNQMEAFCNKIHKGEWKGYAGEEITDIVNIGIGGSDLGPMMVTEALKPYAHPRLKAHFVSNVDGMHLDGVLKQVRPGTTLFIISSKTFTTQETMMNAHSARSWFLKEGKVGEQDIYKHFVAVSTNIKGCIEFGISENNIFAFWEWVGGRYSLWSSIGLSIAITIGYENFVELLGGAHQVDLHFATTPVSRNIPFIMALVGVWYHNFFGAQSYAVLPYSQLMHRFSAYLQQLDMESNGKRVTRDGNQSISDYTTGPIVWGEPGTNGQHAFYQLLHQGTHMIPCDFIGVVRPHPQSSNIVKQHQSTLLANLIAQPRALMCGSEIPRDSQGKPQNYREFVGNKPTTTIMLSQLTPRALGALIALYEHKIFVQGVIWDINSFDQWGVELGKTLAKQVSSLLQSTDPTAVAADVDDSTKGLIEYVHRFV